MGPAGRNEQVTGINILRNKPSILSTLQKNVRAIRAVLHRAHDLLSRRLADHPRSATPSASGPCEAAEPRDPSGGPQAPSFDIVGEERLLREEPAQGVSRRGRASASPSRQRCRARSASALPPSSRPPSRRCSRSGPRAIQGSPILLSLPIFLLSVYTCTLPQSDRTLQYLYYSNARMQLSIHRLAPSSVKRH